MLASAKQDQLQFLFFDCFMFLTVLRAAQDHGYKVNHELHTLRDHGALLSEFSLKRKSKELCFSYCHNPNDNTAQPAMT